MSNTAISEFLDNAISDGPMMDTSRPIQQWDDYTLAWQYKYQADQIQRAHLNLQTLEIWPENRGPLFNEETIYSDFDTHMEALKEIIYEISRRHIP